MAGDDDIRKSLEDKLDDIKTFVDETLKDEAYTSSQKSEDLKKIAGKNIEDLNSNILILFLESLNELFQGKFADAIGVEFKPALDYLKANNKTTLSDQFNPESGAAEQTLKDPTLMYDCFFPKEVYIQLATPGRNYVDSELLDLPAGEKITRAGVANIALKRLEQKAADMGIEKSEITQKMFEGKFNPYHADLQLAFEGTFEYKDIQATDVPASFKNFLVQIEHMEASDEIPHEHDCSAILTVKRREAWNETFGSIESIGDKVNTSINDKDTKTTPQDLGLRLYMRLNRSEMERTFKGALPRDPKMTYDQAMAELQFHPHLQDTLAQKVTETLENASAPEYFSYESGSGFNLYEDYQKLRYDRYIDEQKQSLSVKDKRNEATQAGNDITGKPADGTTQENKIDAENKVETTVPTAGQ